MINFAAIYATADNEQYNLMTLATIQIWIFLYGTCVSLRIFFVFIKCVWLQKQVIFVDEKNCKIINLEDHFEKVN